MVALFLDGVYGKAINMISHKLMRNRIQCPICLDIIESRTRHDFVVCSCGVDEGVFVDGGLDYQRFGGGAMAGLINLAELEVDDE